MMAAAGELTAFCKLLASSIKTRSLDVAESTPAIPDTSVSGSPTMRASMNSATSLNDLFMELFSILLFPERKPERALGLKCEHGTKDFLDQLHAAGIGRRLHIAYMVGTRSDYSHWIRELVDCLSQRLVLTSSELMQRSFVGMSSHAKTCTASG